MTNSFKFFILFWLLVPFGVSAQNATLRIVSPENKAEQVKTAKQFITGATCKDCIVTIGDKNIKVYKTGVFVFPVVLNPGENKFTVTTAFNKKSIKETVIFTYTPAKPVKETDSAILEKITIEPSGDVALTAGEYLLVKVKAKPNCTVIMNNKYTLTELPKSQTKGIGGYYQLQYKMNKEDKLLYSKFKFELKKKDLVLHTKTDNNAYTLFEDTEPMVGTTTMVYTPVYSGLGEDRLGGTKAGFLDSAVQVQIIGRVNNLYKVQLHNNLKVFIPKDNIQALPAGNAIPKSLSGSISAIGDSAFDYVRINLSQKLPYLTTQNTRPNQVVVNVFGATINTNWITQAPETLEEIENLEMNQLQDGQLQITVDLKSKQLWGYQMYYEGNTLVLKVRRPKKDLQLSNMVIGLDAGHGGSNEGAKGIAGKYEKEFTLLLTKELQNMLEAKGAKVMMTRETDISFENQERLKMLRKKMPDFLISIHLNSAEDPLRVKGISTYYKYNAFRALSANIYKRVVETGLHNWGNIGNFNFFGNSATEFPSALVECLFISNPEDEEKVFDPAFRTLLNQKIVAGIEDWLELCAKNR